MPIPPALLLLVVVVCLVLLPLIIAAFVAEGRGLLRPFLRRLLQNLLSPPGNQPRPGTRAEPDGPRYRQRPGLLTAGEREFFPVVESVLPDIAQHLGRPALRAFAKVRLADLIEPDCGGGKGSPYMSWFGKIKAKHVDVVLVNAETFAPVCVVELDDKSHNSARAQKSDAVKDQALRSAGVPLVRIAARASYDRRAVGRAIAEVLGPPLEVPGLARGERMPVPPN